MARSSGTTGLLLVLWAIGLGACQREPYCLNCVDGAPRPADAGPIDSTVDGSEQDAEPDDAISDEDGTGADAGEDVPEDVPCDPSRVTSDPRHCGTCGNRCSLPHAVPACVEGRCIVPTDGCDTGFYDLNRRPEDGCEYACVRVPGAARDTTCDRRDDDCDGQVDEDVDLCTDVRNCGACGQACRIAHATPRCVRTGSGTEACTPASARCEIANCDSGFHDLDRDPSNGCEYECTPSGPEVCDGRDNDCNGAIDDGVAPGGPCGSNLGACRAGTLQCVGGGMRCMGAVEPTPETCNGVDDDCNGRVDDGTLAADTRIGTVCGGGAGECLPGRQVCRQGMPVCEGAGMPSPEVCDGRDNDCNGMVDDGVPPGEACGLDVGACRPGRLQCVGGTMRCAGGVGPTPEACNGVDDDCDGAVDNGFDLARDPQNCGVCGNNCNAGGNALHTCQMGVCTFVACAPGFVDLDRNPANGCEYACMFTSASEVCNGVDDDCDGQVDEDVTPPANFCRTVGPCAGATVRCSGRSGFTCSYSAAVEVDPATGQPVAVETRCDGVDNNCNGATDESFTNLGQSCTNGATGRCNTTGRYVCDTSGSRTTCNAPPAPAPGAEICNGVDDDCDGQVDEIRAAPGSNPSFVFTSWVQYAPMQWIMQYEASRPDATTSSQGTMSQRACSTPGVLPWTNLNAAQAAAACQAAGGRLCGEAEWQTACRSASGSCTWSYASGCSGYQPATCNGIDSDVDPATDGTQNGLLSAGAKPDCFADFLGGIRIFDMSGNAKEFTAPRRPGVNPLRGGAYNNIANGTSCTFNWTVVDDAFAFVNTGFRCCYTGTAAP